MQAMFNIEERDITEKKTLLPILTCFRFPIIFLTLLVTISCSDTKADNPVKDLSETKKAELDFQKAAKLFKSAVDTYTYEKRTLFFEEITQSLKEMEIDFDALSSSIDGLSSLKRIEARQKLKELRAGKIKMENQSDAAMKADKVSWIPIRDEVSNTFTELMSEFHRLKRTMI